MQELNLDVAGEFLVMAATLIHMKSRTLLPRPETSAETGEPEEDPREALVRRLLEHQKYKAAAELLHERQTVRSAQFMRPDARVADGDGSRPFMIVTFLAVLEMIRLKLIRVFHGGSFGAIRVYKRARPADAPHPIGDPENS